MTTQNISFVTHDQLTIRGTMHLPAEKNGKAIILAHGITVDRTEGGIFSMLAARLADAGYAVLSFDFRGHGASDGRAVDMTITGELMDLTAAVRYVATEGYPHVGLLGASFGGGIASLYAGSHKDEFGAVCLWNPVLDYDHCFLNPTLPWLVAKRAQMKKDIAKQGWAPIGSRKFMAGKALFEEMARFRPHDSLQKIAVPLAILHGDADTHVPFADSKTYCPPHALFIPLPGAGHGFHESPHTEIALAKTLSFFSTNL